MTMSVRELFEQPPAMGEWQIVELREVEDGDIVSLDLAALAARRTESAERVDWSEVYGQAHAVAGTDDLGESVRLAFYDLTHPTVVGVPDMRVLRLR